MIVPVLVPSPQGDLTKTHHKAQPPHELSTPFHCFYHPCTLGKIPSKGVGSILLQFALPIKCQITSPQQALVVNQWKQSFFLISLHTGRAGQKHPSNSNIMAEPIGGFWSSPLPPSSGLVFTPLICPLLNIVSMLVHQYLTVYSIGLWSHKQTSMHVYCRDSPGSKSLQTGLPRAGNSQ